MKPWMKWALTSLAVLTFWIWIPLGAIFAVCYVTVAGAWNSIKELHYHLWEKP